MQALYFGMGIVTVAIAGWVYFDATDRGIRFAWLWALSTLILLPLLIGLLVLFVYLLVRGPSRRLEVAEGAPLRLYLADATLSGLVLVVSGAATAMSAALAYAVSDTVSSDDFRDVAASAISAFVVGGLVWWPHWRALTRRTEGLQDDGQFRAMFVLWRTEVLTAVFLFGVVAVMSALVLLGGAITALFRTSYGAAADWLPALGVLLACAAAAGYHTQVYRRGTTGPLAERSVGIPAPLRTTPAPAPAAYPPRPAARAPQAPPPVPPPRGTAPAGPTPLFCVHCGTQAAPQDVFCRRSGARLARSIPASPGLSYGSDQHL